MKSPPRGVRGGLHVWLVSSAVHGLVLLCGRANHGLAHLAARAAGDRRPAVAGVLDQLPPRGDRRRPALPAAELPPPADVEHQRDGGGPHDAELRDARTRLVVMDVGVGLLGAIAAHDVLLWCLPHHQDYVSVRSRSEVDGAWSGSLAQSGCPTT